jgi:hypothetical protein
MIIDSMTKKGEKTTNTVNNILNDRNKFRMLVSASNIQNVGIMRMYLKNKVASA